MKKFIIFLIFMPQLFYGQWVQQYSVSVGTLNDIFCVTEDLVFAVGYNGTILKTIDGGAHWIQKTSGTTVELKKIQFTGATTGYAISSLTTDNVLLKTSDGGDTWNTINFGGVYTIMDISCIGPNIIYLYYKDQNYVNILKKSVDGGLTFQVINANVVVNNIQFITEMIGFASGNNGLVKTIDGGITWSIIYINFSTFYFINENTGFVKTSNGFYKTINGGINFTQFGSNINNIDVINKIYSINENIVWGVPVNCLLNGSPCFSLRTEMLNSGSFQLDQFLVLKSIHFASSTSGYCTNGFKIYKNTTGTLGIIDIPKNSIFKIAPNPVTNQIKILLDDLLLETTTTTIIDSSGKNIFSKSYNGENIITIDTQNFSKGVYFLSVTSGESKQTQKLIIN